MDYISNRFLSDLEWDVYAYIESWIAKTVDPDSPNKQKCYC